MRISFIAVIVGLLLFAGTSAGQAGKQSKGKAPDKASPTRGSGESSSDMFGGKTIDQWRAEMKASDASKRARAVFAMLNFKPEAGARAVPDIIDRLRDNDVGVRTKACFVLRYISVEGQYVARVVNALATRMVPGSFPEHESQAIVRYEAGKALGRFVHDAGPVTSKLLIALQDRSSYESRRNCVWILWQIGRKGMGKDGKEGPDPLIVEGLLNWIRNEYTFEVKLEILQGLGAMGKPANLKTQARLISDLQLYATSRDKALAIWAYAALVAHDEKTSKKSLSTIAHFLSSDNVETKIQAAVALGGLGSKARNQVPAVLGMLKKETDKEKGKRNVLIIQGACMALSRMADPSDNTVLEALLNLLKETDPPHPAAAAVKALVDLKQNNPRVIGELDKMLKSGKLDPGLYAWVQDALKELRGEKKK
jgi:HEAT repeat protein